MLIDENAQERLEYFLRLSRTGGKLIPAKHLLWLGVIHSRQFDLKEDTVPFRNTKLTINLTPHSIVMTQQDAIGSKKVNYYLEELMAGNKVKKPRVTDVGPSKWWHLDGLHRILAARILGQDIEAKIYR